MRTSLESNTRLENLLIEVFKDEGERDGLKALLERHKLPPGRSGKIAAYTLVNQIRRDGSNSVRTLFGDRLNYDEIVRDVASQLKIRFDPRIVRDERDLELLILQRVFKEYFDKLSPEEREDIYGQIAGLGVKDGDFNRLFLRASGPVLVNVLAQVNGRILWQILARIIGARVAVGIGWFWALVPFLNFAFAGWIVWDMAGPAYRKTIPTVVQVAMMRLQFASSEGTSGKLENA